MQLSTRFGRKSPYVSSDVPLSDDRIRAVAPSIFAEEAHGSRSAIYTYIRTADVLAGLRREGFEPFYVCQTRVRDASRREHTKHMLRLRHAGQIQQREAPEVILVNSHDGTSSYQMLAGMTRFVCSNGLVCGDLVEDVRIPHKGQVVNDVIQGAFDVLDGFDLVREVKAEMEGARLTEGQSRAFATAALTLRFGDVEQVPAPVTVDQILTPRRHQDLAPDLWTTFNRVQENLVRGGLSARTKAGARSRTREVTGIDQGLKLNRALWVLAQEMQRLQSAG